MGTINAWSGGQTPGGFAVVARVTGATARLAVSTAADLSGPRYFTAPISAEGVARFAATGLQPHTGYWWAVETDGVLDTAWLGQAITAPTPGQPTSFRFTASSCSGHYLGDTTFWPPDSGITDVSNHAAFDNIRAAGGDFFIHSGDLHYRDIVDNDPAPFRQAIDDVLTAPRQAALYRSRALYWMADDHDGGPDNRDSSTPSAPAFRQVYRERAPYGSLPDPSGLWQTWVWGRVRFVLTDLRTERSPNSTPDTSSKRMLGAAQEQWFTDTLAAATEPLIVWISTVPWLGPVGDGDGDSWNGFDSERRRLAQFFARHGLNRRLLLISGDAHALGMDDGRNNHWGGFPEVCLSGIDSDPGWLLGPWSPGWVAGRGLYGTADIRDDGDIIMATVTGYQSGERRMSLTVPYGARLREVTATYALVDGEPTRVIDHASADLPLTVTRRRVLVR